MSRIMTTYYILFIDGTGIKLKGSSKTEVLNHLYKSLCIDEPFHEFIKNINLIEWKDLEGRHVLNYMSNTHEISNIDTPYRLERYCKQIKLTKLPKRELIKEFEIYYED